MMQNTFLKTEITELERGDKYYPRCLLDLEDAPLKIYIRGDIKSINTSNCMAVVGSRLMTNYGRDVIRRIIPTLSRQGMIIVSGFMYGVDTAAHEVSIAQRGKTVAVLGSGLNHIYPAENAKLYQKIIQSGGCIISEYPPDFKPQRWTFPKRNRIVAALSEKGTIVVEAALSSGSLITASYADALNRPLYAVPGPITSKMSEGTNMLIRDGLAKILTSAEDVV